MSRQAFKCACIECEAVQLTLAGILVRPHLNPSREIILRLDLPSCFSTVAVRPGFEHSRRETALVAPNGINRTASAELETLLVSSTPLQLMMHVDY